MTMSTLWNSRRRQTKEENHKSCVACKIYNFLQQQTWKSANRDMLPVHIHFTEWERLRLLLLSLCAPLFWRVKFLSPRKNWFLISCIVPMESFFSRELFNCVCECARDTINTIFTADQNMDLNAYSTIITTKITSSVVTEKREKLPPPDSNATEQLDWCWTHLSCVLETPHRD